MSYRLSLRPDATDSLKKLDKTAANNILKKLKWLTENAENAAHRSLSGDLKGFYKLRVGDYRAIYKLNRDEQMIVLYFVGHRRDVYTL